MTTRSIRLNARIDRDESLRLKRARDDLRIAANHVIRALYLHENNGGAEAAPPHTMAYRMLSGNAGVDPVYRPTTEQPVSGGVRCAVATHAHQRWRTDRRDVERGAKSLATFRRLPLIVRGQEVRVVSHEAVEMLIWGRAPGAKPRWIRAAVKPVGARYRATWRAIVRGTLRHGDARLQLDRLGRWYILLSHQVLTELPHQAAGSVVRVALPALEFASARAMRGDELLADKVFPPPFNFWRSWMQSVQIRREIGEANRAGYGLRAGRGRKRKLRPLQSRNDKYARRITDATRAVARAICDWSLRHAATRIEIEDTRGDVLREQDATEDVTPRETRAEIRSRFLRQNRSRLREAIVAAAEKRGIEITIATGAPPSSGGESAVAGREAEKDGSRAASGDAIADSGQALERSARSEDTTSDRPESRGSGDTIKGGSRKRRRKSCTHRKKRQPP